jgi:hypothetical protein
VCFYAECCGAIVVTMSLLSVGVILLCYAYCFYGQCHYTECYMLIVVAPLTATTSMLSVSVIMLCYA